MRRVTLLAPYRSAIADSGLARVMAALLACYLLSGMASLALLLAAERATDSYAVAGAAGSGYAIALAVAAPLWGHLADRRGPGAALSVAGVCQAVAFLAFIAAAREHSAWLLVLSAMAAGASTPPSSAVATKLVAAVGDASARRALVALSGLLGEIVFVLGPLVVAGVTVLVAPVYAVALAGATSAVGVWLLRAAVAAHASGDARTGPRAVPFREGWSGALLHVLAVVVLGACAIGAVQVSVVAHAERVDASAGVLLAALAAGGVLASFAYGAVRVRGAFRAQLCVCLGLYGAAIAAMTSLPGFLASVCLLAVVGAATGPADAIETLLVAERTSERSRTRAFSMLVTANWIGFSAGSALAGVLAEQDRIAAGFLLAALAAWTASVTLLPARRRRGAPGSVR